MPQAGRRPGDNVVSIRVAVSEREVRDQVKHAGGVWKPEGRVWELRYEQVIKLRVEERGVDTHSI